MSHNPREIERRHHTRIYARGQVIVRSFGREIHGTAVAVSPAAIEVGCQSALTLVAMAGLSVAIELRLDGAVDSPFLFHGHVARLDTANHRIVIAIATDALPAPLAIWIAEQARRAGVPSIEVIIVDRDLARRDQVAEAFRNQGCHVVEASTSREAIDALRDASVEIDVIAIADTTPEDSGEELRTYLDTAYSRALVIAIGDAEWTPSRARLDPSDAVGLLAAHVQAVLSLRSRTPEVQP